MKKNLVTIYGVFNSFAEASNKILNITARTLARRLKQGFDIDAACTIPSGSKVTLEFIGLNEKAYYKISGIEELLTCRQIIEYYRPDLLSEYDKLHPNGAYFPYNRA